jgi:hypothetical protein
MPVPALVSAIASSILNNAIEQVMTPPPPPVIPMATPGRVVPRHAERGEMVVLGPMSVQINGQAMTLAPGAQIRNAANLIVMPSAILEPVKVRYLLDPTGAVARVWILSDQEAAQ